MHVTAFLRALGKHEKLIASLFFGAFLVLGLAIFKDYGVHWDEYHNQARGDRWGNYICNFTFKDFSREPPLDVEDLRHGNFFEVLLFFVAKKLSTPSDPRDIILIRHLVTFLAFFLGVFFFYRLCRLLFKSWQIALLGCLVLILHPRIFAHSFYNSMDIPFLSAYLISAYALMVFLEKKTPLSAGVCALTGALLMNIRMAGMIAAMCVLFFAAAELLRFRKDRKEVKKTVKQTSLYILLLVPLVFVTAPIFWKNPFGTLFRIIKGSLLTESQWSGWWLETFPPWYYNFKWILCTTPLWYSFCFVVGFFVVTTSLVKNPAGYYYRNRAVLIILFLLLLPLVLPVICKTMLFDGWRHHYFIYPGFVVFVLAGLTALFKFADLRFKGVARNLMSKTLVLLTLFSLINTAGFMIKNHPHQYVYANLLAGRNLARARDSFALDYWGLSYRQGLEHILQNDRRELIKILVANPPGLLNVSILPGTDRNRLKVFVGPRPRKPGRNNISGEYHDSFDYVNEARRVGAEYFIGNYRWYQGEYPFADEYYALKLGNTKYLSVYKIRDYDIEQLQETRRQLINRET